jgi:hypothetical protein
MNVILPYKKKFESNTLGKKMERDREIERD